jgi:MtaA/CmuA family methyltransferase
MALQSNHARVYHTTRAPFVQEADEMTAKERLYAAIQGRPFDRTPVTPIFMAWAAHFVGRTYRDYYLDGDALVQAQLAVVETFGIDQIMAISDPWREASGYGMVFDYPEEGVGIPRGYLIKSTDDARRLKRIDADAAPRMRQRVESVAKLAAAVGRTHSVLGWVEGPLAEYVDLRGMQDTMFDLMDNPAMFHDAAAIIVENAVAFARAQIDAGADMIGVGDAAASLIDAGMFEEFVLPWQQKLFAAVHAAGAAVKLHICGNTRHLLQHLARAGADIIDVDWMVPLAEAREIVGPDVTLCGNFDPSGVLLRGSPDDVKNAARQCICDGGRRFVLMPGCEVPPETPEENLRAFCPGR